MEQYISKNAVVAEIKTRIETYNKGYANGDDCRADALETFLHDIDTLEVKEVKEPTAADKGTAEEIIVNLRRIEQDYLIDLTKEMEWVRSKVQKGE